MPAPCPYDHGQAMAAIIKEYCRLMTLVGKMPYPTRQDKDKLERLRARMLYMATTAPKKPERPVQAEIFR